MGFTNVRSLRPESLQAAIPAAFAEADEAAIRSAARQFASGVAVVTWGSGEERSGLTATSVSPLPAEPGTLLVALNRASAAYPGFARSSRFAVNVLGSDQREVAEHFASFADASAAEGLGAGRWLQTASGLACLADCAAVFECKAEETIERRAGAIVVARVVCAVIGGGSGALLRWRGGYDQLGWSRDEICRAVGLAPGRDA